MVSGLDTLFQQLALRGKMLKNRIFSTGHMAVMLDDGKPTARMVAYHEAKAQGGAALTIIEAARVHPSGDSGRLAIRAYDPACVPGYARLAEACQPHGCLIFAQSSRTQAGKWRWPLMVHIQWPMPRQLCQMSAPAKAIANSLKPDHRWKA